MNELDTDWAEYLQAPPAEPPGHPEVAGEDAEDADEITRAMSQWKRDRPVLNITSHAAALEDAHTTLGTGATSGLFRRGGDIVKTTLIGEDGYIPPEPGEDNGPVQLRRLDAQGLAATIDATHSVQKKTATSSRHILYPIEVARRIEAAPEHAKGLRPIAGVVNTPVLRTDMSVITTPGYDPATKVLYLPGPGLADIDVPTRPTEKQVRFAADTINELIADFPFVTPDDRANQYAAMLAPIIRRALPEGATLPLHVINAPMLGSGKTLLGKIQTITHGGIIRTRLPADGAEIRKQITSILENTTAPVVLWDNVTGVLRSGDLAALLTSPTWEDRRLGGNENIRRPNDRLWTITGNNVQLGGDMARRGLWVTIDPDVPTPWTRDGFQIPNLEQHLHHNRATIISALLVLITNWVASGADTPPNRSDTFAAFTAVTTGILRSAGMITPDQTVMSEASNQAETGADDQEWADFLQALQAAFGTEPFTTADIMHRLDNPHGIDSNIALVHALPGDLADQHASSYGASINRRLGKWISNRVGRYAGGLTIKKAGADPHKKSKRYVVAGGE